MAHGPMLNSLTPHKFQIVNSKLLDVKRKPIKCVKCHCKSRRKYFSHAFCWNVRPFATPAANPVANATCTLNVGGGHGRLISPNLASATSHENWFNQIQVVPVAACQTCSCRDRRLRRNEDPQNGHYEPCRFDKHLDQIQHWMMQTTAVTVDNRWFKSFQISVWSKMLLRNQTQLFWWKGIHCSSNPKQFESAQSLSKIAVNLSIQMQHHVSSRNDSKMPWIFGFRLEGLTITFCYQMKRTIAIGLETVTSCGQLSTGSTSSTNTLPRCLGVIDVVFLLFANRPELSLFNAENSCGKRFTKVYEVFTCALRWIQNIFQGPNQNTANFQAQFFCSFCSWSLKKKNSPSIKYHLSVSMFFWGSYVQNNTNCCTVEHLQGMLKDCFIDRTNLYARKGKWNQITCNNSLKI